MHAYTNAVNGFSALVTHEEAEALAAQPDVLRVMPDTLRQLETKHNLPRLDRWGGAWASGLTGEGVVVGVVDSGTLARAPDFKDDGSYAEPRRRCRTVGLLGVDFGNDAHNPNDVDFECDDELMGARRILRAYRSLIGADPLNTTRLVSNNGHGTHTPATSAGDASVTAEIFGVVRGEDKRYSRRASVYHLRGLRRSSGTLGFRASPPQSIRPLRRRGRDQLLRWWRCKPHW